VVDPTLSQTYLDRLQKALWERGLEVGVRTPALVAKNPSVVGTDAQGSLLCPGLAQKVELRELAGQDLWWCWVWAAPKPAERGAPTPAPEYQPLSPADDIEQATAKIVNVLRIGGAQAGV
jgi:hypothetical protein